MIKSKIKNFTTLNDVLSFIKEEPDWGPNYNNIITKLYSDKQSQQ